MFAEFKALIVRSEPTLLEDAIGVASLGVLLVAALHLPTLI
ncbi:hypothetical protein [Tropicimonas isoalkanivorans]|jgi:hypothetical protein|uniref:Uncharacterized protein n=1 Tax=Tropicimonas isoalkanivorans TaxID=441112 RepID=A0A1I1K6P0_9RHOB|nr:hypothetical protein [Tropicimonas isoalkanivorans]SFC56637.1 hypothetical protein SAMN04488094_10689 [Tropicimonas isoalkanivorans]